MFMLGCFHDLDFFLRQPVQFVHQRVNLPIRRLDLVLIHLAVGGGARRGQALVQLQHPLDERH